MQIDFGSISPNQRYFTMTQTVIPRPVAWVLSDNGGDNGNYSYNLAPFSYFNAICSDPPLLVLSVGKKPGGEKKDSIVNIAERGKFVVHIPHWELAESVTETSRTLVHGDSELDRVDLSLIDFPGFDLPRIAECRVAYACELYQLQEVGSVPQTLIFGEIKQLYLDDTVVRQDEKGRLTVDALKVDPLSRLGGADYGRLGEIKSVPRPK